MKFSALNVHFIGPSLDLLHSMKPVHEGRARQEGEERGGEEQEVEEEEDREKNGDEPSPIHISGYATAWNVDCFSFRLVLV